MASILIPLPLPNLDFGLNFNTPLKFFHPPFNSSIHHLVINYERSLRLSWNIHDKSHDWMSWQFFLPLILKYILYNRKQLSGVTEVLASFLEYVKMFFKNRYRFSILRSAKWHIVVIIEKHLEIVLISHILSRKNC